MKNFLDKIRMIHPIIHCITNYVTVNDCANILLACGASPIMADDAAEVGEITSICSGTVLNIGTLNARTIESMLIAGKKARELEHPVVFDPAGAGASRLRTETSLQILREVRPDIVRCNVSEFKMLMHSGSVSRGVDASAIDQVTDQNLRESAAMLLDFCRLHHCITAVSGAIDLIASYDGRVCAVRNGHPMMTSVTGSGCMLTALTGAFAAVSGHFCFESVCEAFCTMGIAGETAYSQLKEHEGNATLRNYMIDAFCHANYADWERKMCYEML